MNIHYLGPRGTFSERVAQKLFPNNDLFPSSSIDEVVSAVKKSTQNIGILPIENTVEGIVIRHLDLILAYNLRVNAELNMPIIQSLLTNARTLNHITDVYSHPQAIAQTRTWLIKNLPKAQIHTTESTAKAVEIVQNIKHAAAIGSASTAQIYKARVLEKNISNNKTNSTRFWVISKKHIGQHTSFLHLPATKTSLYLVIHDKVGALRNLLDTFSQNDISLTSIQSRPLGDQPWKYGFFIDILVDAQDPFAKKMFATLKKIHPMVSLLGTYPQIGAFNKQSVITYNVKRIRSLFQKNYSHKAIASLLLKSTKALPKTNAGLKKILATRLAIMPSVALFKYKKKHDIQDRKREKQLLKKMKVHLELHHAYADMFHITRNVQKKIIELLKKGECFPTSILAFPLKNLRYYIDYLDTLARNSVK